jgi:hypothetical protein
VAFLDCYCEIQQRLSASPVAPAYELLKPDAIIHPHAIPKKLRICPYCDGNVFIHFESWTQNEDGSWSADFAKADCDTEPRMGGQRWEEWIKRHTYMPYVYWMPLEIALTRWVNKHYRFDVDGRYV